MSSPHDPGWESVSIGMDGGTVTALRHSKYPSLADTLLEVVSARLYSFGFSTDRPTVRTLVRIQALGVTLFLQHYP